MISSNTNLSVLRRFFSSSEEGETDVPNGTAYLRFPDGEWPVSFSAAGEREGTFGLRYLRDIQFLVDSTQRSWRGWEDRMADESCPVLEFDPEWFAFLLPPKEETRMELFAWYWLWAEPTGRLTLSRYAWQELGGAFEAASALSESAGELERFARTVNDRIRSGCGDFREFVADPEAEAELRVRLERGMLWFPGLVVDCEPREIPRATAGTDPELAVWGYVIGDRADLSHVAGQVRAVRSRGAWKLDPRAIRTHRAREGRREIENRSALPE